MQATTIKLEKDKIAELDQIAKTKTVSRGAVIRWAIDAYLNSLFLPIRSTDSPNGDTVDRAAAN
jgi:hypothetical protein